MKETLKNFLAKFDMFNQEEINAIAESTQLESFRKGTILLQEGEICRTCYFVLSGCIRQYQFTFGGR